MEDTIPISLNFDIGIKVKKPYYEKLRQMIPVYSYFRSEELSYFEILKFIQNLPFYFKCSQSYPRNTYERNFSIVCLKCDFKISEVQISKKEKNGKIYIYCICKHFKKMIHEYKTKTKRVMHFDLNMDENQVIYFKSRFTKIHPFRMIGKDIYESTNESMIRFYLQRTIFSKSWEYSNELKISKCSDLNEIISSKNGYFYIYSLDSKINQYLLTFNNKSVQCLVWIPSYINDFIGMGSYIQIDASFYALSPYVYSIPLLIYNNASIPLGIIMGPSENEKLYEIFYQCVENIIGPKINNIPILSDEGTAIASFALKRHIDQYYCYRHMIEKIGSNTYIAQIVKRLLFIPKIENYEIELVQAIKEVNNLIKNNEISVKTTNQFIKIFGLNINNNTIKSYSSNHSNGLWNRQLIGISTCSNHIESLHRALNTLVANTKNINKKTNLVFAKIIEMIDNFERNSRKQAVKLLKHLSSKAEEMEIPQFAQCNCNCGWDEVYSNRFGINNFPCIHSIKLSNLQLNNLILPESKNKTKCISMEQSIDGWLFSEISNDKNALKSPLKMPEFEFITDKSEHHFLVQTAKEISLTKGCIITMNDILIEISKQWGAETIHNPEKINDIDFRAYFRYKMYKTYINNK